MIKLFVGLGNPGSEYDHTRHNAGFWWIDALAAQLRLDLKYDKNSQSLLARGSHQGESFWLMQPQTFMNRSGFSVATIARFYKIAPADILVIHDELDIVPGAVKLKLGGSNAGHNGLKDIHAQIGSPDFWRLRIGIGHPGVKAEVIHWVLKKPSPEHRNAIDDSIAHSLKAVPQFLNGEMEAAMKLVHTKPSANI
jgi:peptidyl-tRNA hydrolase, PTH1 family